MNFNELAWAAFCFYYRSAGDKTYGRIMSDSDFLHRLRETPSEISDKEFETKVILDYIDITNYDLLKEHKLAHNTLGRIIEIHPEISSLKHNTLLDCDLSDNDIIGKITNVYTSLSSIDGLWVTGSSKIAHLINDKLFTILNLSISDYFGIPGSKTKFVDWLKQLQKSAKEAESDFHKQGFKGSLAGFLSDKLGCTKQGYEKSLAKFLDEYYWLTVGDNLIIPPTWIPPQSSRKSKSKASR